MATYKLFLSASEADDAITNSYRLFDSNGLTGESLTIYGGNIEHFNGFINSLKINITGQDSEASYIRMLTGGARISGQSQIETADIINGIRVSGASYIQIITGGATISGGATLNGGTTINNGTTINGGAIINENTYLQNLTGGLRLSGGADITGYSSIIGNTAITGAVNISGSTTITGSLFVNGVQITGGAVGGGGGGETVANTGVVQGYYNDYELTPSFQGITVSGSRRGEYSVDFQLSRNQSNQIATGDYSVLIGGLRNRAAGLASAVFVGSGNHSSGNYSTVIGGATNSATGLYSSIIGGLNNKTTQESSVIVGGNSNTANGKRSIVFGGIGNYSDTENSYIFGQYGKSYTKGERVLSANTNQQFGELVGTVFTVGNEVERIMFNTDTGIQIPDVSMVAFSMKFVANADYGGDGPQYYELYGYYINRPTGVFEYKFTNNYYGNTGRLILSMNDFSEDPFNTRLPEIYVDFSGSANHNYIGTLYTELVYTQKGSYSPSNTTNPPIVFNSSPDLDTLFS